MMAKTEESFGSAIKSFTPANDIESMEYCGALNLNSKLQYRQLIYSLGGNQFLRFGDALYNLAEYRRTLHREVLNLNN